MSCETLPVADRAPHRAGGPGTRTPCRARRPTARRTAPGGSGRRSGAVVGCGAAGWQAADLAIPVRRGRRGTDASPGRAADDFRRAWDVPPDDAHEHATSGGGSR
ncbi:hypothetical protein GCM10023225_03090 [Kineococcus glutinatus]|uniref:Uncharacterized protein n=1 Tax=Kineococcus glutinatus TaxID=1070872 RepID=A0ABP9H7G0_9ACTN